MRRKFLLRRGENVSLYHQKFEAERPTISVTGSGRLAYVWVGGEHGPCYATLGGKASLLKMASSIQKALRERNR